jgi:catechol 2,3-dioxygenase-like lactoylglutathione lyase family enzyme
MHIAYFIIPCRDQDEARAFYTEKLGFELVDDMLLEEGVRWLTFRLPGQELQISVVPVTAGREERLGKQAAELLALGGFTGGIIQTDDVHRDCAALKAKGVEFTEEPTERFYGIDSGFRDPSGIPWRLTQIAAVPSA